MKVVLPVILYQFSWLPVIMPVDCGLQSPAVSGTGTGEYVLQKNRGPWRSIEAPWPLESMEDSAFPVTRPANRVGLRQEATGARASLTR